MSILIKGMEMPKDCWQCPFEKCVLRVLVDRHPDCPLVEVPTPHGRLIDADVLNTDDMIESWVNGDLYRHEWCIDEWINNAPTIIEAEEGEE